MLSLFWICGLFLHLTLTTALPASSSKRQSSTVPSYVLQYAPILYLHSQEAYNPSDIGAQLIHTTPYVNYTPLLNPQGPNQVTLNNLAMFDTFGGAGGSNVYLTSKEGIQANPLPSWLHGVTPDPQTGITVGAISCAIVTVAKPGNILDAFYFYFYAYNQGDWVFNDPSLEFGDHVGDWEHNMVRFVNGVPQAVWYSQHASGEAFTYSAVQKQGLRPVTYVANGTHANYAITGSHDHLIPGLNLPIGALEDQTNQGRLWDAAASATAGGFVFSYDENSDAFSSYTPGVPTAWLSFFGRWGDDQVPSGTPGQEDLFGNYKYVAGPTGPFDKELNRTAVCSGSGTCVIRPFLTV